MLRDMHLCVFDVQADFGSRMHHFSCYVLFVTNITTESVITESAFR